MSHEDDRDRSARWVGISFGVSALASMALAVVYLRGGQPQLEGLGLGLALGGIAVGLALWGKELLPKGPFVQERDLLAHQGDRRAAEESFEAGAEPLERRSFLVKMLTAALGALGLAALFPIRSLGEGPGSELLETPWRRGLRVVDPQGHPLRVDELGVGGVLTVFPEDHTDAADAQILLIRLAEDEYRSASARRDWAPRGFVAFSKICTHAGCPVGLYQQETKELFCPCHQSVFQVLEGALPSNGPATRPLPQLPLMIDDDGYILAAGEFSEPVGPGFWNRPRD